MMLPLHLLAHKWAGSLCNFFFLVNPIPKILSKNRKFVLQKLWPKLSKTDFTNLG
jgi:hypothetical protein